MVVSADLKPVLVGIQQKEISEHVVYKRLSQKAKGKNSELLKKISDDELRHYTEWKSFSKVDVSVNRLIVWKYLLIQQFFGLMFMMKLMEENEEKAQAKYSELIEVFPSAAKILAEESQHENLLISMIDEKRLNYLSVIISGLNDALIELAGELAGFTFALQNPALVGFAGLIAGIAQFLSSSASEMEIFLTERTTENKEAIKKSLLEGSIYLVTVFFLVIPFFLVDNPFFAMGISGVNSFVIIVLFTYYVSIVKELALKKMFAITLLITLGVGAISFMIGWVVKTVLNL